MSGQAIDFLVLFYVVLIALCVCWGAVEGGRWLLTRVRRYRVRREIMRLGALHRQPVRRGVR